MALLAICLYAAFAQGATRSGQELGLQLTVAVLAELAALAAVLHPASRHRARPERAAVAGLALLGLFSLWSLLSLLWSSDPPGTWRELNRLITYGLVLALAIGWARRGPAALTRAAGGIFVLAVCVACDALGEKVLPGLHLGPVIDLNRTGTTARLQDPLGYWNALALLVVLGAPAGLGLLLEAGARGRRRRAILALVGLELIVVTVGFSESRGGFLALFVALGVGVALSPDRLVALAGAVLACAGGAITLSIGLSARSLTQDGVGLAARESAGLLLLIVLVGVAVLSALVLPALAGLPEHLTRQRRRRSWRVLGYGLLAALGIAVLAAAFSGPGLSGQLSRIWASFSNVSIATSGTRRLFSVSSANRAAWWGQALRAFAARPLTGWGAGSFPEINLLFRHTAVGVQDAHSVPLQWLAETGLPGAALALGAWLTLLGGGVAAVWRMGAERVDPTRLGSEAARRRLAAAALLAAAAAYSVHALYDWDWDIPGVTLPVLIALGVLTGIGQASQGAPAGQAGRRPRGVLVEVPELTVEPAVGPGAALLRLSGLTAALCLFAASALAPVLAADRVDAALADAARGGPSALAAAQHAAALATLLDPVSGAGPAAEADVAVAEDRPRLARDELVDAVARQPTDESAWTSLLAVDLSLRDGAAALAVAQRVLALDPRPGFGGLIQVAEQAASAEVDSAPPTGSATAGTG